MWVREKNNPFYCSGRKLNFKMTRVKNKIGNIIQIVRQSSEFK